MDKKTPALSIPSIPSPRTQILSKVFKISHKTKAHRTKTIRSAMQVPQATQDIAQTPPASQNLSHADTALSIPSTTLILLRDAAQSSPVPLIRSGATLALAMLENIQVFPSLSHIYWLHCSQCFRTKPKAAKENNQAFNCLAVEACLAIHTIISSPSLTHHEGRSFPRELIQNLENVIECVRFLILPFDSYLSISVDSTLREMNQFLQKQASRKPTEPVILHDIDVCEVQEYKQKLINCLALFTVRHLLSLLSSGQNSLIVIFL